MKTDVAHTDYTKTHPDFDEAAAAHRWQAPLKELVRALELEADKVASAEALRPLSAARGWAWKVLPRGAFVAVRRAVQEGAGIYELRLSRREPAKTPAQRRKWEDETRVFLRYWGIEYISKAPEHDKPDGVATAFRYAR